MRSGKTKQGTTWLPAQHFNLPHLNQCNHFLTACLFDFITDYGYWSQWGAWGGCSKNCHQGRKSRSRTCLYKPTVGPIKKVPCSGGSHIHYQPCNVNKPCLRKFILNVCSWLIGRLSVLLRRTIVSSDLCFHNLYFFNFNEHDFVFNSIQINNHTKIF